MIINYKVVKHKLFSFYLFTIKSGITSPNLYKTSPVVSWLKYVYTYIDTYYL